MKQVLSCADREAGKQINGHQQAGSVVKKTIRHKESEAGLFSHSALRTSCKQVALNYAPLSWSSFTDHWRNMLFIITTPFLKTVN